MKNQEFHQFTQAVFGVDIAPANPDLLEAIKYAMRILRDSNASMFERQCASNDLYIAAVEGGAL